MRGRLTPLVLVVVGCARTAPVTTAPTPAVGPDTSIVVPRGGTFAPGDTSLVAAVARTIADSNPRTLVRLKNGVNKAHPLPLTGAEMARDTGAVYTGIAAITHEEFSADEKERIYGRACLLSQEPCSPKQGHTLIVAVGTPHKGGPKQMAPAYRKLVVTPTMWTVSVTVSDISPGHAISIYDYVFEKANDKWTFVRAVGIFDIDIM
jgi:hypothetical protein